MKKNIHELKTLQHLLLGAFLFLGLSGVVWTQEREEARRYIIERVDVRGQKSVDESVILGRVKIKPGQEFSLRSVKESIRRIYELDFFEDIRVEATELGGRLSLSFIVKERPLIEKLEIVGNKKIKTKDIENKISLHLGSRVDGASVFSDKTKILELYHEKGYMNASVYDSLLRKSDEKAHLKFIINEGEKVKIQKVEIEGNRALSEQKVLSSMKLKKRGWRRAMKVFPAFSAGNFQEDTLRGDLERIVYLYKKNGFIDAKTKLDSIKYIGLKKDRMILFVGVDEGQQYRVGKVELKGDSVIQKKVLLSHMRVKNGEIFNQEKFDRTHQELYEIYTERGYIYCSIQPEISPKEPKTLGVVDVGFNIVEGKPAHVRRVNIAGNTRTREKVIRRELLMIPGDLFRRSALINSRNALLRLGFFESVQFEPGERDTNGDLDISFIVKEKVTGQFQVGTTYSAVDKFTGYIQVAQPNLFGKAQVTNITYEFGKYRQNIEFSFTEPWFKDTPTSVGFDVFNTSRIREYREETRRGGGIRLAKPVPWFSFTRLYWSYRLEQIKLTVNIDSIFVPPSVWRARGSNLSSSTSFSLIKDTRDNYFNAESGTRSSLFANWSGGILGGSVDYQKYIVEGRWYHKTFWKFAVMGRMRTGIVNGYTNPASVPVYERFYLGGTGEDGIRGYGDRAIGPRDPLTLYNLGGRAMLIGTIEHKLKITNSIYALTFFEAGNAWLKVNDFKLGTIKKGAGVGIRLEVPMLGIIGFDYGYGFERDGGLIGGWNPHFQLGGVF